MLLNREALYCKFKRINQLPLNPINPGTVKIDIRPYDQGSETDSELEEAVEQNRDSNWPKRSPRQPFKPLMDPQVVKEFLMGDYCLYGGTGWWKYEFCYGEIIECLTGVIFATNVT